jgi:hypothetical protein
MLTQRPEKALFFPDCQFELSIELHIRARKTSKTFELSPCDFVNPGKYGFGLLNQGLPGGAALFRHTANDACDEPQPPKVCNRSA